MVKLYVIMYHDFFTEIDNVLCITKTKELAMKFAVGYAKEDIKLLDGDDEIVCTRGKNPLIEYDKGRIKISITEIDAISRVDDVYKALEEMFRQRKVFMKGEII